MKSRKNTDNGFFIDRNIDIRFKYAEGKSTILELSKEYQLSPITIRKIINSKGMKKTTCQYEFTDFEEITTYCNVMPKYNPKIDG